MVPPLTTPRRFPIIRLITLQMSGAEEKEDEDEEYEKDWGEEEYGDDFDEEGGDSDNASSLDDRE